MISVNSVTVLVPCPLRNVPCHHNMPWGQMKEKEEVCSQLGLSSLPSREDEVQPERPEARRCSSVLALRSEAMWSRQVDRAGLLLIPPLLLALQLLVVGPRLPSAHRRATGEQDEAVFTVISIEPETRSRQSGELARRAGVQQAGREGVHWGDERGSEGLYEDENEMNSRQVRNSSYCLVITD